MRKIVASIVFIGWFNTSLAQYFQFSQYNFTPQRINPAQVGNSDYASLSFDYRNQVTDGGFHLTSNILNASYPIFARNGRRWSGVGITLMDDRSGQAGIFNTQEVGVSYAINVPLAKYQTISLGFKGLYQNRKIDLDGLFTGSQYVPDRGFSEALASGENTGQFDVDFMTFSAGLYWQQTNDDGTRLAYWGISFFDFNKPENSFFNLESHLNSTFVASLGLRVYQRDKLSIFPELLYTRSGSKNVLNAGFITQYDLKAYSESKAFLNIITKYVLGRSGIVGLQLYKENLTIGLSYDFPVIVTNVANTGAVEVGVELRKLVIPRKRNKNRKKTKASVQASRKQLAKKPVTRNAKVASDSAETGFKMDTVAAKPIPGQDLSSRLKEKQDSVRTNVEPGKFRHEPLVLEKATLDFTFGFNSTEVDDQTARYLNDLAEALRDNPELRLRLVGHTDNIGSDKFNLKLSFSRAQKIKDYLIAKGIGDSRISIEGKGMREPLNDNSTQEKRALNRRVELTILYDN
jgi:type IX secretion system PorP/SprF family membrane protein